MRISWKKLKESLQSEWPFWLSAFLNIQNIIWWMITTYWNPSWNWNPLWALEPILFLIVSIGICFYLDYRRCFQ